MSDTQTNIEEYPFRKRSVIPFLLGLPVLIFFAVYPDTPALMRGLSTVVLTLAVIFYFVTRGKFKGFRIENDTLQVTNGLRIVQSFEIEAIEKIIKDGASFAVDYKDVKTGRLARLSVLKGSFSEDTWKELSRKLASIRN